MTGVELPERAAGHGDPRAWDTWRPEEPPAASTPVTPRSALGRVSSRHEGSVRSTGGSVVEETAEQRRARFERDARPTLRRREPDEP